MTKKHLVFLPPIVLGLVILMTSILRASSIKYDFEPTPAPHTSINLQTNYQLPPEPIISPNSPLWPISVGVERVVVGLAPNEIVKANQLLTMADKRLVAAVSLVQNGEPEVGVSTLTKAEKYLEQAHQMLVVAENGGMDTSAFKERLVSASEAHNRVIGELIAISPETARPIMVTTADISHFVYLKLQSDVADASQK